MRQSTTPTTQLRQEIGRAAENVSGVVHTGWLGRAADLDKFLTDPRLQVWKKLAGEWNLTQLKDIITEVTLEGVEEMIHKIMKGEIRGRVVVSMK